MKEPYEVYVEMYGKIKSGGKLEQGDFGETSDAEDGYEFEEYDEKRKLAVSLAAQDAHTSMRTKRDFEEKINDLQN